MARLTKLWHMTSQRRAPEMTARVEHGPSLIYGGECEISLRLVVEPEDDDSSDLFVGLTLTASEAGVLHRWIERTYWPCPKRDELMHSEERCEWCVTRRRDLEARWSAAERGGTP